MPTSDPEQRREEARAEFERAFEIVCPGIIGNPFLPHWPLPKQAQFLGAHLRSNVPSGEVFEALYGGAAGGGKSDALLMAQAQYAWGNGLHSGLVLRRTYTDLALPGAIMDRAVEWWKPRGVHWNASGKIFTFPSGAKVAFGYLANASDHLRYQGSEFQTTCWDESTQFPDENQYTYVARSRCRRTAENPSPLRALSASNPGGVGHGWNRRRHMGGIDPVTGEEIAPVGRYFPARIQDNPFLVQDEYIRGLEGLHPTVREQLLNGDWDARDPGDYFRREWFGPLLDPEVDRWPDSDCVRVRWWDLAASEKDTAARTAGVLMARHRRGVRAVEHAIAFRRTPGARDAAIIQQAEIDGPAVAVGLEIEPGSGGIAQFDALSRELRKRGFRVVGARPKVEQTDRQEIYVQRAPSSSTGKEMRADPVAACLERGWQKRGEGAETRSGILVPWAGEEEGFEVSRQTDGIRLFAGVWTQAYLDEVEGFPDLELKDLADATSGAWAWLQANAATASAPLPGRSKTPARLENLTPEEREEIEQDDQRTPAGRWRQ